MRWSCFHVHLVKLEKCFFLELVRPNQSTSVLIPACCKGFRFAEKNTTATR